MAHRVAVLDMDLCQPRKCGLECVKYCPVNKSGAECVTIDEASKKARIDEDICNGCGICVKVCPFEAITIVNLATELSTDKVHQYGPNSFRLYRLPVPKKGAVIGLLGRNGIGKSTVVGILAGTLRPNMGRHGDPPAWDEILEMTPNIELRSHLSSIGSGALRASTKPQQTHAMAAGFGGTAAELLERHDERGAARGLVGSLGLQNSMERRLGELSGGELQRLAVAAAAARDADYYFFDEPSSHNDVFQRGGVARVIRSLAEESRSVMVVEHDLAMLDFLSDYIEVMYGEPAAYGIVSGLLPAKSGINTFLDGYLPGENVRFRDRGFTFEASSSEGSFGDAPKSVSWPALTRSLGDFELAVEAGSIRRGEALGVMGANALGKTTMMRMLAGAERPDSGTVDKRARISHKPQYVRAAEGVTVEGALSAASGAPIAGSEGESQIAAPLRLPKFYPKDLSRLSGGELQKVAVAACLLRDADLYALDEPSAFLDVEDRIAVAKFIQRFARSQARSVMVIDHDLQLMDIVSDTMVVFEGEPGRSGRATAPLPKPAAMNRFLASLGVSFRRDERSRRPRINKPGSRLDRDQKASGSHYYAGA